MTDSNHEKQKAQIKRFWEKVKKTSDNSCWEWQAYRHPAGYGRFKTYFGTQVNAHRFSWEITYGEIPSGMFVCHKCDNRPCIRPDHLFLGTQKDNVRDALKKNRMMMHLNAARGSDNLNAKLFEADIPVIIALNVSGESMQSIATKYNISPSSISKIISGKAWKHVQ